MKKITLTLLTFTALLLTSCLETTQELSIKEDGSGTITTTSDMSALLSMLKQMGGSEEMGKQESMDSTIFLDKMADSMQELSDIEKELVRKGSIRINMNMQDEKFITVFSIPFSKAEDISACNALSGKVFSDAMKAKSGGITLGDDGGMPGISSFDDYYTTQYSNGLIVRTLNKEKFSSVGEDEFFKGMKEMSAMGMSMKTNYIINLPRPVKNAEGKGLVISEDKMKITITADMDDFMDEPEKLEYRIEY